MPSGIISPARQLKAPVTAPGTVTLTYKCVENTDVYEILTAQFIALPNDVTAATVLLNDIPAGTLSGASTYGPVMLQMGDVLSIVVPGLTAGDVGQVVEATLAGYWTSPRPDPPPIAQSGGLGQPPTSGGSPGTAPVAIVSPVGADGGVETEIAAAGGATVSTVPITNASTVVVAANAARRGLILVNDQGAAGTNYAFVCYGAGASLANYTVPLVPGAYWEMPEPPFTGQVTVIGGTGFGGAAANGGNLQVTELT